MDSFTARMLDHARNPRNPGTINNADGIGHVESSCGDWVNFTLRLSNDGRITDCRFNAHGCGSAIASASVLSEMAKGRTVDEAARITAEDVVTFLGGVPEHKTHCSVLSHAAFQAAVESVDHLQTTELPV